MNFIKNKLDQHLSKKSVHLHGVTKLEEFVVKRHFICSQSFECYATGQSPPVRRVFKSCLLALFMLANTIKYGIFAVYDEPWLLALFGEFLYKLCKMKMMALIMVGGGLQTTSFLLMHYWLEYRHRFVIMDILNQMQRKTHRDLANNDINKLNWREVVVMRSPEPKVIGLAF